ncbi:hypothetical protein PENOC_112680 [Penicillium occitanis (nom. inval.)]|nr:hypothetical protein PENOC_112680 [Penicillium occitanis (nom. inval.)]
MIGQENSVLNNYSRKERALLMQIQEEYDLNALVLAIQQQLNGEQCDDDDDDDDKENAPAQTAFIRIAERRYIAECVVRDPSVLRDQKGYAYHVEFAIALIALCKRRDRRPVKTRCSPEPVPVKSASDSPRLSQIEPEPVATCLWRNDSAGINGNTRFRNTSIDVVSSTTVRTTPFLVLTTMRALGSF